MSFVRGLKYTGPSTGLIIAITVDGTSRMHPYRSTCGIAQMLRPANMIASAAASTRKRRRRLKSRRFVRALRPHSGHVTGSRAAASSPSGYVQRRHSADFGRRPASHSVNNATPAIHTAQPIGGQRVVHVEGESIGELRPTC